jgi:peptide-methionine (S)-S-oxide reductase
MMLHKRRLILSLLVLSLLAVAVWVSQTFLAGKVASSGSAVVAGKNIGPPIDLPAAQGEQTIVLAGGCFWGVEAVFENLQGVSNVVSGFAGGSAATANYDEVSSGTTGHAEAVKITYDPQRISYGKLLKIYFLIAHDPTQIDQQEPDVGTQYRSAIFFSNAEQQKVAQAYIDRLNQSKVFNAAIATKLSPLAEFYGAEDYHQNFIARNPNYPYVVVHDLPKLAKLRQQFPELIKKS